jgi:hypothetical protein
LLQSSLIQKQKKIRGNCRTYMLRRSNDFHFSLHRISDSGNLIDISRTESADPRSEKLTKLRPNFHLLGKKSEAHNQIEHPIVQNESIAYIVHNDLSMHFARADCLSYHIAPARYLCA